MALIRTWSNGWFTSIRMHESMALPCIFGCDADYIYIYIYIYIYVDVCKSI
jgi:hypothetical protein